MLQKKPTLIKITLKDGVDPALLYGSHDHHIRMLEKAFDVRIGGRGGDLIVEGDEENVQYTEKAISELASLSTEGFLLGSDDVTEVIRAMKRDSPYLSEGHRKEAIPFLGRKKLVAPKSPAQQIYIDAIRGMDLVVGIGPAGTGKTYLAMAMAVSSLMNKDVLRITLVRPAVEAGEKLGFLPGDMREKVDPFLRPLYDALYDMMEVDRAHRLVDHGEIEIAPLAFMRGRTLNDSFIILDEAQNTTPEQMKMFLTRLGTHSKMVITGDITQTDLPPGRISGLAEIQEILKDVHGIKFVYFKEDDVVRHRLVQEIVKAYDRSRNKKDRGGIPDG